VRRAELTPRIDPPPTLHATLCVNVRWGRGFIEIRPRTPT
jgi:hypothetical protein